MFEVLFKKRIDQQKVENELSKKHFKKLLMRERALPKYGRFSFVTAHPEKKQHFDTKKFKKQYKISLLWPI